MTGLTNELVELFKKRVYDLAGVLNKKIQVFLNNELITINSFEEYA